MGEIYKNCQATVTDIYMKEDFGRRQIMRPRRPGPPDPIQRPTDGPPSMTAKTCIWCGVPWDKVIGLSPPAEATDTTYLQRLRSAPSRSWRKELTVLNMAVLLSVTATHWEVPWSVQWTGRPDRLAAEASWSDTSISSCGFMSKAQCMGLLIRWAAWRNTVSPQCWFCHARNVEPVWFDIEFRQDVCRFIQGEHVGIYKQKSSRQASFPCQMLYLYWFIKCSLLKSRIL